MTPISHDDHGPLYGAGFFETFRTRDGVPVRLDAHLARLRAACDRIGIRIPDTALAHPASGDRLREEISRTLREAGLADGVVRLTLTAGTPRDGFYPEPHCFLTARALPPEPPATGIALHFLKTVRDTGEWRPRPKSLNYLNSLLASRELAPRRTHPADEAVMCDARGFVAEGVFANLVWLRDGGVFTPHEDTGRLPGVGLAHLLSRLRERGVPVREVLETPDELLRADAIAAVSCVRGVVPVARVYPSSGDILREYDIAGIARLAEA